MAMLSKSPWPILELWAANPQCFDDLKWNTTISDVNNPWFNTTLSYLFVRNVVIFLIVKERQNLDQVAVLDSLLKNLSEETISCWDWNTRCLHPNHPDNDVTLVYWSAFLATADYPKFLNIILKKPAPELKELIIWNQRVSSEHTVTPFTLLELAHILAANKQPGLLNAFPKKVIDCGWNIGFEHKEGIDTIGLRIAMLAALKDDYRLFNWMVSSSKKNLAQLNWNTCFLNGPNLIFFALLIFIKKRDSQLLQWLKDIPSNINWNAGICYSCGLKGMTLAWLLTYCFIFTGDEVLNPLMQTFLKSKEALKRLEWLFGPHHEEQSFLDEKLSKMNLYQLAYHLTKRNDHSLFRAFLDSNDLRWITTGSLFWDFAIDFCQLMEDQYVNKRYHFKHPNHPYHRYWEEIWEVDEKKTEVKIAIEREQLPFPTLRAFYNVLRPDPHHLTQQRSIVDYLYFLIVVRSTTSEQVLEPDCEIRKLLADLKRKSPTALYQMACFCLAKHFTSHREEFYKQIERGHFRYRDANFELAFYYYSLEENQLALSAGGASGSDSRTSNLRSAFYRACVYWSKLPKKSKERAVYRSFIKEIVLSYWFEKVPISPSESKSEQSKALPEFVEQELNTFLKNLSNRIITPRYSKEFLMTMNKEYRREEEKAKMQEELKAQKEQIAEMQARITELEKPLTPRHTNPESQNQPLSPQTPTSRILHSMTFLSQGSTAQPGTPSDSSYSFKPRLLPLWFSKL